MVSQELLEILRCPNCVREKSGLLEYYREAWLATVPLVDTGQVPIGWIDESRWKRETEAAGKVYDPAHPGFTTQFIGTP